MLRGLVEQLGPEVFDDPDNFRGALDDVLDEEASLGEQNLVVDAVRLGAYASMVTMLRQGGEPASTVAQAGAMLARDRGGDDRTSASWACACLAYAVGAVDEAAVRYYRTAQAPPEPPVRRAPPPPYSAPPPYSPPRRYPRPTRSVRAGSGWCRCSWPWPCSWPLWREWSAPHCSWATTTRRPAARPRTRRPRRRRPRRPPLLRRRRRPPNPRPSQRPSPPPRTRRRWSPRSSTRAARAAPVTASSASGPGRASRIG